MSLVAFTLQRGHPRKESLWPGGERVLALHGFGVAFWIDHNALYEGGHLILH